MLEKSNNINNAIKSKCEHCHKFKCKYYNNKLPYLSIDLCEICYGRKEFCLEVKPELVKIYPCVKCIDFHQHNFKCDKCDDNHELCLCFDLNNKLYKYPYTCPY